MSLTNRSLRVTMHVELRVGNVLSWRDLWAFKLLVWEVDSLPLEREDTKTAWVAPASMMLPSGAELPKSLTDHQDRESWVQPVAFWMMGGCTPFPSHSTGMASTYLAPRSRNGDAKTGSFLFAKSQTDRSLVFPMRKTLDEETTHSVRRVWPTCERAFAWMLREPGRWTGMSLMSFWLQNLRSRIIRQVSLNDLVPPSLIMYDTTTALSHIRHTTWDLCWGRDTATLRSTASISYWCAGLPAAWTTSLAAYGSPAVPPSVPGCICKESDLCL